MSKAIERIKSNAEKLAALRRLIDEKDEERKREIEALKLEKDALSEILLADLRKEGLSSIKTDNGDTYARTKTKSLEITSEIQAFKWAYENRAVSINKTLVKQKLADATTMPAGFEFVESEFISVRKPAKKAVKVDEMTGEEMGAGEI